MADFLETLREQRWDDHRYYHHSRINQSLHLVSALAFVCAAKGYELVLTLPQGMSRERESLLRLYGARVEVTESLGGMTRRPRCWSLGSSG